MTFGPVQAMLQKGLGMSLQKRNALLLCIIACVYIALFIPVNVRCAANSNMLICASLDEYAQFPNLMNMMKRDTTLLGSIRKTLDHHYYYYGYPFFSISAAAVLPVRILFEFRQCDYTRLYLVLLRQLSPLFTAAAIMMLVAMWTRFRHLGKSVSMFVFLAAIPTVFMNNTWWHPDGIVSFFVVLTLFSLDRDQLRFGKWFWVAAVACGLATATKALGLFFFAAVPLCLSLGILRGTLTPLKGLQRGLFFVLVMGLSILVSYPIIILKYREVWEAQMAVASVLYSGFQVRMDTRILDVYRNTLLPGFGLWPIYILPFAAAAFCTNSAKERLRTMQSLAWVLPIAAYYLFIAARRVDWHFIPILLPFFAMIWASPFWQGRDRVGVVLRVFLTVALSVQMSIYVVRDLAVYRDLCAQERNSPSIAFYHSLVDSGILTSSGEASVSIFRDPYVYLPPDRKYQVRRKWGGADYSDLRDNPDLILLQQDLIERYSAPSRPSISIDQEEARRCLAFYGDAKEDGIKGYRRILESRFAVAFRRIDREGSTNQAVVTDQKGPELQR